MNLYEIMKLRRSYRGEFKSQKIDKETMRYLLEAAYLAPSGCNLQTAKMIGVLDDNLVKKLAEIYGKEWALTSTAAIVIVTRALTLAGKGPSKYLEDFGAAAQSLLLAVAEKGLATTWIQGQIAGEKSEEIKKLLKVDEEYQVIGYFPLGYPKGEASPPKKQEFLERCFLDEFGKEFK